MKKIRIINEKDLETINRLAQNFNIKYTNDNLKNTYEKIIVYEINNLIVAYLDYSIYYERAEINYIFVEEKFRNQNIGTKLLNYMFNDLKNIENITLEVRETNYSAIRLYKKNGFEICSIRNKYYGKENGLLMIKKSGE